MYFIRSGIGSLFLGDGAGGQEVFVTEAAVRDVLEILRADAVSRSAYLGHVTEDQLGFEGRIHRDEQFRVGGIAADTLDIVTIDDGEANRERLAVVGAVRLHGENDSSRQLVSLALMDAEAIQGSLDFSAFVFDQEIDGRMMPTIDRVVAIRSFDFVPRGDFGGLIGVAAQQTAIAIAACSRAILGPKGDKNQHMDMDLEKLQKEHPDLLMKIRASAEAEVETAKSDLERANARIAEIEAGKCDVEHDLEETKAALEKLENDTPDTDEENPEIVALSAAVAELTSTVEKQAQELAETKAESRAIKHASVKAVANTIWREESQRCGLDPEDEADKEILSDLRASLPVGKFVTDEGGHMAEDSDDAETYRAAVAGKVQRIAERIGAVAVNAIGALKSRADTSDVSVRNGQAMDSAVANVSAAYGGSTKLLMKKKEDGE